MDCYFNLALVQPLILDEYRASWSNIGPSDVKVIELTGLIKVHTVAVDQHLQEATHTVHEPNRAIDVLRGSDEGCVKSAGL